MLAPVAATRLNWGAQPALRVRTCPHMQVREAREMWRQAMEQ